MDATRDSGGSGPGRFVLTVLIGCFNNAPLMAARLVLPMIAFSMGQSAFFVGIIASLFTAVPIVFNVAFGRWVDRSGTRAPMLVAGGLVVVSCLVPLAHLAPATLLVSAGLIGCGAVFAHVAATRAVGEIGGPALRTRNLGYLIASYSMFQFIVPMISGASFEHFGAGWAIATLGGFGVLAMLGLGLPWHHYRRWSVAGDADAPRPRTRELLGLPRLGRWLTVGGIFSGVVTIFPFIVALQALRIGLTASQAGMALGAFAIGNMIARAASGMVGRRLPAHAAIAGMLGGGAALYAAVPLVQGFAGFAALSGVMGLVLGMGVPFVLSMLYSIAPEGRVNEVLGLSMLVTNSLQTALPLVMGVVAAGVGGPAMSWMLALMMVVAMLMALRR